MQEKKKARLTFCIAFFLSIPICLSLHPYDGSDREQACHGFLYNASAQSQGFPPTRTQSILSLSFRFCIYSSERIGCLNMCLRLNTRIQPISHAHVRWGCILIFFSIYDIGLLQCCIEGRKRLRGRSPCRLFLNCAHQKGGSM